MCVLLIEERRRFVKKGHSFIPANAFSLHLELEADHLYIDFHSSMHGKPTEVNDNRKAKNERLAKDADLARFRLQVIDGR